MERPLFDRTFFFFPNLPTEQYAAAQAEDAVIWRVRARLWTLQPRTGAEAADGSAAPSCALIGGAAVMLRTWPTG